MNSDEMDIQLAWDIVNNSNQCIDSTDGHLAVLKGILIGRSLERQEIIDSLSYTYYNTLKNAKSFNRLGDVHRTHAKNLDNYASFLAESIIELIAKKMDKE